MLKISLTELKMFPILYCAFAKDFVSGDFFLLFWRDIHGFLNWHRQDHYIKLAKKFTNSRYNGA